MNDEPISVKLNVNYLHVFFYAPSSDHGKVSIQIKVEFPAWTRKFINQEVLENKIKQMITSDLEQLRDRYLNPAEAKLIGKIKIV